MQHFSALFAIQLILLFKAQYIAANQIIEATLFKDKGSLTSTTSLSSMELNGCVQTTLDGGVLLDIEVQPGSSRQGITGINQWRSKLTVAVKAEAQKGKANEAVLHVLAKSLTLTKSDLTIVSGHTSRAKRVSVKSIAITELLTRLNEAISKESESNI